MVTALNTHTPTHRITQGAQNEIHIYIYMPIELYYTPAPAPTLMLTPRLTDSLTHSLPPSLSLVCYFLLGGSNIPMGVDGAPSVLGPGLVTGLALEPDPDEVPGPVDPTALVTETMFPPPRPDRIAS